MEYAFAVIMRHKLMPRHYDLPERIASDAEWIEIPLCFLIAFHAECRLDVILIHSLFDDKIDLIRDSDMLSCLIGPIPDDHSDINTEPLAFQVIVYSILHQMSRLDLPEIQSGIPESSICRTVLCSILQIGFSTDIIAAGF